jgi:hypothetical protein
MNACHLLHHWCLGLLLVPCLTYGQNNVQTAAYTFNDQGNTISSNVPLNEINSHALRNFHRIFPKLTGSEYWFHSSQGYQVSFSLEGRYHQAYFDEHGYYRYSLHHYAGKEIPREPGDLIKSKYPDYQLNIVTEITDGEKIVYLVRLVSPNQVKTISLCDDEIRVVGDELISDPAGGRGNLSSTAGITSRQSYP